MEAVPKEIIQVRVARLEFYGAAIADTAVVEVFRKTEEVEAATHIDVPGHFISHFGTRAQGGHVQTYSNPGQYTILPSNGFQGRSGGSALPDRGRLR